MATSVHDQTTVIVGTPSQHQYGRYLAIVLVLPLLAFLLTFPLAASQGFLHISRRPLWHATQYRFMLPPQQNCDVVIAGESSGMMGVDPYVIEARTGWKACNLALPYDDIALAGTRVLDGYLANNKPPRFIVFHFNGNHLHQPKLDEDNGIVDGWLMVDEHFPAGEKLRLFAAHPLNTLRFVTAVWKQFLATKPILRPDWSGVAYLRDMKEQIADRGWMPEQGTTQDVVCGWQAPEVSVERTYLDSLAAHYTRGGTRAIIWANPARDCDVHISQYQENAKALGMPPTAVYNRALFFDAFHLNTEGAARNATELVSYLISLNEDH